MNYKTKLLLSFLALSGCSIAMSNDDIIKEVRKCTAAGLYAYEEKSQYSGRTIYISCTIKPII